MSGTERLWDQHVAARQLRHNLQTPMTTVLIVEDDFKLAAELEWALADAGHTVIGKAASFEDMVGIVASQTPEIALDDNWLKGAKDGGSVARHLRSLGTKIIYMTAEADPRSGWSMAKRPRSYPSHTI